MKKPLLSITIIASLLFFGCGSSDKKMQEESIPAADTSKGVSVMANDSLHTGLAYICPCGGCPEVMEPAPGNCPKCELELVEKK